MSSAIVKYTVEQAADFIQRRIANDIPVEIVEVVIEGHTNTHMPFPPIDDVPAYVLHGIMVGNLIQAINGLRADSRNLDSDGNPLLDLTGCRVYVEKIRDQYFGPYADRIAGLRR